MNLQNHKHDLLPPTNLYDAAKTRLHKLKTFEKQKESSLQKNLPNLPGKIHVVKTKEYTQYYLRMDSKDKSGNYIRKKDEATIRKYLQKAYDEKVLKLIRQEIKSIEAFLKHSDNLNHSIQKIYSNNSSEVKSFLIPIDCSDEDFTNHWLSIPYQGNPMPIQTTEYKTERGEYVRSKSELNIANALFRYDIPYKYECPITLKDERIAYPDFTILVKDTRNIIYWEHRGMMDDREYARNSIKKIKDYSKCGIIIGVNLFITEETSMNPLGTDEIIAVISAIK